jgi:predicted metal-dependent phosphoesterase TrpH
MAAAPDPEPTCETSTGQTRQHTGARWWSLDIHAHSPASFDYGGLEGRTNDDPKPSFKEWIQAYVAAGVDGIVVTDHNSHDGIEPARQALEELLRDDPYMRPLVIFPGVELTATGGIHILGSSTQRVTPTSSTKP